jgi:serine/threonine protein kinase
MGEVYKARDTRLDRTVAIKVLPAKIAANAEARQRLEREARAVSALSHPHICTLYDIGEQDGLDYLVLEYLEGETLSSRLKQGPLPLDSALRYAIEIAGALDRAHRQGIVHRDLKPGNIMLTRSGSKLLDFGLAKVREAAKTPSEGATASLTRNLTTTPGAILGTFQYMSPEQLEAREADARSDIFAFGAVLFEMLTGRKAFDGGSQASLIASILTAQPAAVSSLQSLSPVALDRVVRTCFAKDPDQRWQSAGDLGRELAWIAEAPAEPQTPAARPRVARIPWAVATAAVLAALSISWLHFRERPPEQRSIRFTIPTEARLPAQVRISPDGMKVAFVGQNAEGKFMLWVRPLDKTQARALSGTEGADSPFWSPDSRQIAFYDPYDHLKRIDAAGGQAQIICDANSGLGGDWNENGAIVFAPSAISGIYRVSASGGVPVQVTKPPTSPRVTHGFPVFLPDGRHFLYLEAIAPLGPQRSNSSSIFVGSLDSKEAKPLVATDFNAAFSAKAPAHLLFVRDAALMAQEMDTSSLQLRGEAVRIEDALSLDVPHSIADFSVSKNGILALNTAVNQHELVWLNRAGNRLSAGIPVTKYGHPTLSPDGRQALFTGLDPKTMTQKLWNLDVERGELSLFDNDGDVSVFFPDGKAALFACKIDDKPVFCRKATGGAGRTEVFWDSGGAKSPMDFSADGRFLSYIDTTRRRELWILPLTGERHPYRFYPGEHAERHGMFSPDGKWIAYSCNETGDFELYVQPFPATGAKFKVSAHGGAQPRWRGDGKELFYRTEDGKMMAVSVKTAGGFEAGVPHMLFPSSADPLYPSLAIPYAVTKDGQRFLLNVAKDEGRASPITIITNWTAALGR